MPRYRNDPREMLARFNSKCAGCGEEIKKGERIAYWPNGKKAYHWKCGEADLRKCMAAMAAEDVW
jgi:hypothetical protein